jgi:uncharacterized protein (TIGR01777 family)
LNVLIAGGGGFLGSALAAVLRDSGHEVKILTRRRPKAAHEVSWDGRTAGEWIGELEAADAVVNACGYGLQHWPWTSRTRRRFLTSRVDPGRLLAASMARTRRRPKLMVQFSGINYYGFRESQVADETTPPGDDFLARLAVEWEAASETVEDLGVRRVIVRNAIVLHGRNGLFPLMCLPARLFLGGRIGGGGQAVPWIHLYDHAHAIKFLLETQSARGPYNLVAPAPISNAELMEAVCHSLHRPYWLHAPAVMLRVVLGEMATLVLNGRPSIPGRLLAAGYDFSYSMLGPALDDLLGHTQMVNQKPK